MPTPLDPDNLPTGRDRLLRQGHGTSALGPSDTSDSGSDMIGVGPDVGDSDLDSDTDARGTGERASATPDEEVEDGADIAPDRVDEIDLDDDSVESGPRPQRRP